MVQAGSHVDRCAHCDQLTLCGEFWNVEPRFRVFICSDCLQRAADSVRQAAVRYPEPAKAVVR